MKKVVIDNIHGQILAQKRTDFGLITDFNGRKKMAPLNKVTTKLTQH